ncbi:MAG TPA: hypothetical protein VFH75_06600 [Actinomycetota bacterium]|nr:hypothetical protein [Actinomycetota bacterium]
MRKDVRTTYLGNYAWATANEIAEALEEAGIFWWCKNPGTFTRVLFAEFGVRMFVDQARLDEAREIARGIVAEAEQGEAG